MTKAATVTRTDLKEIGTNQSWNWRLTVFNQDDTHQTTVWPISTWLSQLNCAVSACSPLPLPIHAWNFPLKALVHRMSVGVAGLQTGTHHPQPPAQVASLQTKANFPFLFIGFRVASSWLPLSVTWSYYFGTKIKYFLFHFWFSIQKNLIQLCQK